MLQRLVDCDLPFRRVARVIALALLPWSALWGADWSEWGGPSRNFEAPVVSESVSEGDLSTWSTLWRKDLGLGYSAISVVGDRLVTMDRDGDRERIVCLSAATGDELWSFAYDAPHLDGMRIGYGTGPHATPLIHDGRVFAVGATALLHSLSLETGELVWKKDLWGDVGGTFLVRGYASSPLVVDGRVVVTAGGEGQGFVAFEAATGEEAWRGSTFKNSQSSPVLLDIPGPDGAERILIAFANDEVVAADPVDGSFLWSVEHKSGAAYNIGTPVFDPPTRRLFVSSAYGGGTRALEISRAAAEELWHTNRLKIHYTNMLYLDGHLYGTTGNAGTVILAGLDTATGKVLWKDRKIVRSQLVSLGGTTALALTEDGELLRLGLRPSGVTVEGRFAVEVEKSWTPPTVVGERIYLRTEGSILALGPNSGPSAEPSAGD